jgi:hypothetical protein
MRPDVKGSIVRVLGWLEKKKKNRNNASIKFEESNGNTEIILEMKAFRDSLGGTVTERQMQLDAEKIFNAVMEAKIPTYEKVIEMIVENYATDSAISRSGLNHATKRLRRFYRGEE